MSPLDAIIVLGCRVGPAQEALGGAAGRRVARAATLFRERTPRRIVASGGRSWSGVVEADRMARELERLGVPAAAILRERCSMSTAENARYTAALAERHALRSILIVTCTWHLERALRLFRREGFASEGMGADSPDPGRLARAYRTVRERVCMHLDGVA
jgi:uncharacterized SAM-binding protein YcdF (DUF218 family)